MITFLATEAKVRFLGAMEEEAVGVPLRSTLADVGGGLEASVEPVDVVEP